MSNKKKVGISLAAAAVLAITVGFVGFASANAASFPGGFMMNGNHAAGGHPSSTPGMAPGVIGTVSAISGNTISLTGFGKSSSTIFSIDASNATIIQFSKGTSTTVQVGSIKVGDRLAVMGAVNGTAVTATKIFDGAFPMRGPPGHGMPGMPKFSGVIGTVSAVNGTSFSVTSKMNKTSSSTSYTVDASNAKVIKNGAAGTVSNIQAGDKVFVQGSVNGAAVTATMVLDGMPTHPQQGQMPQGKGIMGHRGTSRQKSVQN